MDYDELASLAKQYDVSTETKQRVDDYYEELMASISIHLQIFTESMQQFLKVQTLKNRMERIQREINEAQTKKTTKNKMERTGDNRLDQSSSQTNQLKNKL